MYRDQFGEFLRVYWGLRLWRDEVSPNLWNLSGNSFGLTIQMKSH